MKKYVNIRIEGGKNIGVISLGDISKIDPDKLSNYIRNTIEPKLVNALESHFDCEIKIVNTHVNEAVGHINVASYVLICSLEQDYYESVFLEETWLFE